MSATNEVKASIKPEVLAAITAALALYGYSADKHQISKITKGINPWRKAGIVELMLSRELLRDFV